MRIRMLCAAAFCAAVAFGQTKGASPSVNFSRDVAPILYKHCVACHHPGDIAPMSLLTYKDARPWAAAIKEAVASRKMPPWTADPNVGHWANDPRLSDQEIQTIRAWVDSGKAEGNPKDMPPQPTFPDGWRAGKPDVVFSIPTQTIAGTGPDEYKYIEVPTNFKEDMWIVSAELRPGNRKVVHHAHVFVKQPSHGNETPMAIKDYVKWMKLHEGTLEWVRAEAPVINDGCAVDDNGTFPDTKQGETWSLIGSYLPGRSPDVYPVGTARKVPAGAVLSFQIHYSRTTGKTETDATSVGLIFSKEPPKALSLRLDLSNHLFMIPKNDPDQVVTECHTLDKDILLTSVTPHMHLRGSAMNIYAMLPDGRKQTLLAVPNYQFNWQFTYREAEPVFLPKGTRIEIEAHFDNSANHAGNPDPNVDVRWGSASEREMMDGWFEYIDPPKQEPVKLAAR